MPLTGESENNEELLLKEQAEGEAKDKSHRSSEPSTSTTGETREIRTVTTTTSQEERRGSKKNVLILVLEQEEKGNRDRRELSAQLDLIEAEHNARYMERKN